MWKVELRSYERIPWKSENPLRLLLGSDSHRKRPKKFAITVADSFLNRRNGLPGKTLEKMWHEPHYAGMDDKTRVDPRFATMENCMSPGGVRELWV